MHHGYLTPKQKCFQLSLKLSTALSCQKDYGRSFHAETAVVEAGVCPRYHAYPIMCGNTVI